MDENEILRQLEESLAKTNIVSVVMRTDSAVPKIEYDSHLTQDQVVSMLLKAMLVMTIDDFIGEYLYGEDEDEDEDEDEESVEEEEEEE